ncbi:Uncharacterised protein (plasmid) [Mesomycoplasma neurolyticum]|uniref:Uncharacterized protein n=1 Tax=Mesomycoplasma neurolyticum TaxID=2120 RepID=A0A449A6N8_9BACT|nr:Uncharacterised protein [Mesomycoplasma neurolyticum]VEU59588.1 Uncharacterised protein [Mesomycoplasma neurolyticum]VEU59896.1 Uncharacterised protein [Mesomycoplasma neurolyticum]
MKNIINDLKKLNNNPTEKMKKEFEKKYGVTFEDERI